MPGFTPGRRWQPAYYPYHKESLFDRTLETVERTIKGLLFGCRMCGNCLLQETAFICPMECPKGLRNGPCGGSTAGHCYVDPSRPCIWYKIYERSEKMGRTEKLMEVLPPLDWDMVGTDSWKGLFLHMQENGGIKAVFERLRLPGDERADAWEKFFYDLRQPDWWQGDDKPHPAPAHKPVSVLEEKLTNGEFVVTAEVAPPIAAETEHLIKKLEALREVLDAVNFTDNPSATPRMSSFASSLLALQVGLEPVMQIAARERTRMGIQAEILGAAALGIRNVLCITGDHASMGPSPHGRLDILDLDSVQMIWMLRRMRDENHFLDGREIKSAPQLFLGAAGSPFASETRFQAVREKKKSNAGAQFFQTNLIYDPRRFQDYLEALDKQGVLEQSYLLAGVAPIRSYKAAKMMQNIPGIEIPDSLVTRMEKATDGKEEGIQICLEIVEQVKNLPGVNGIHFMAMGWESIIPRLVRDSGLAPQ